MIAKRADSRYEPGKRTGSWVELKLNAAQESFVDWPEGGLLRHASFVGVRADNVREAPAASKRTSRREGGHP